MSEMEIYYGTFKESDKDIVPDDTDEFYDMEEDHGCGYVMVKDQLYEFRKIENLDPCGFLLVIPPKEENTFMAYWYNGGAEIHEVVEALIETHVGANNEEQQRADPP